MPTGRAIDSLELLGDHRVLDFVNSLHTRVPAPAGEYLESYEDLAKWSEIVGLIDAAEARRLRLLARAEPAAARRALGRALALREALYRVLKACIEGAPTLARDLDRIDREVARGAAFRHLVVGSPGEPLEWRWRIPKERSDGIVVRIAAEAGELLVSPLLDRVKECPPPDGCGYLFLDRSKNSSRRWCKMANCGNVAKVRRHRRRRRARRSGTPSGGEA